MVGVSIANEISTTPTMSLNSTGATIINDTATSSTKNDSTKDANILNTTNANNEGDSSVTSLIITTTDNTTTGNAEISSSRTLTTNNTKGTTELTSKHILFTTPCYEGPSGQPQYHIFGFTMAGVAIFLAVVWSFCLCCWYRRKLARVKSRYDAERAISMHEVNGRKVSDVKFSVGKVDKELSSVSRNVHSENDEHEDRSSDLYDLTDPDYEFADGTKSGKAKKCYDDDEEDSEYDMLNDEEKMKHRESEYACAEFKTSGEDLDNDTYDTTETCNRIKCKKHENCGEKHSAENIPNVNSNDETEPQNQTNEMKADSKINNQVSGEENQEEENKNSEDKTTVKDLTTVDNKTTAVEDTTSEDKKTVKNKATVENKAMIENKTTNGDQIKSKDDATGGDSDGKINKPFEKSKTSEVDDDAKCSTSDYELVKIIQTPNDTTENAQGRPTAV